MKKFAQTLVSLVALIGAIYAAMQNETVMMVVSALCVALVGAVGVIKFNQWIFTPDAPKPAKHKTTPVPDMGVPVERGQRAKADLIDEAMDAVYSEPEPVEEQNSCEDCERATCKGCNIYEKAKGIYEKVKDEPVMECETCNRATCDGCELYESSREVPMEDPMDIDAILDEFREATDNIEKARLALEDI